MYGPTSFLDLGPEAEGMCGKGSNCTGGVIDGVCTKGEGTGGGVALGIDGGMDSAYDLLLASSKNRSIRSFCDCTLIVSELSISSTGFNPC